VKTVTLSKPADAVCVKAITLALSAHADLHGIGHFGRLCNAAIWDKRILLDNGKIKYPLIFDCL